MWKLDEEVNKGQFEGKWEHCQMYYSGIVCEFYFLMQQDNNICGTWQLLVQYPRHVERFGGRVYGTMYNSGTAESGKICNDNGDVFYESCDNDFLDWSVTGSDIGVLALQSFIKEPFNTSIKTPFPSIQKEDLIKNNKWLRDCLNYKGE